jgi:hypothetical protein
MRDELPLARRKPLGRVRPATIAVHDVEKRERPTLTGEAAIVEGSVVGRATLVRADALHARVEREAQRGRKRGGSRACPCAQADRGRRCVRNRARTGSSRLCGPRVHQDLGSNRHSDPRNHQEPGSSRLRGPRDHQDISSSRLWAAFERQEPGSTWLFGGLNHPRPGSHRRLAEFAS